MTLDNDLHFIVQIFINSAISREWVTIAAFNHVFTAKQYARSLTGDIARVIDARASTIVFEHRS